MDSIDHSSKKGKPHFEIKQKNIAINVYEDSEFLKEIAKNESSSSSSLKNNINDKKIGSN